MRNKNWFVIAYYGLIAIAIFGTAFLEYEVPVILSIFNIVLIFLPLLNRVDYAPFILPFFMILGAQLNNTFFYPTLLQLCVFLYVIIIHLTGSYYKIDALKFSVFIVILYYLFINFISGDTNTNINKVITVFVLGSLITRQEHIVRMSYAFIGTSLICSIFCFVRLNHFSIGINSDTIEEALFVYNPNKYACTIGIGFIAATMLLADIINGIRTKGQKVLSFLGIVLSIISLGLLSSRGAMFSCMVSSLVLLLLSPKKMSYKSKLLLYSVFLFFLLYVTGVFDYFIYRMSEEQSQNLSGRPDIWAMKYAYFKGLDFSSKIIGVGKNACFEIGYVSSHNDFVTALVGYGYIGVILFIYSTFVPLFKSKSHKFIVFAMLFYYIGECFVLEPVFRGHYGIMLYYLFVYSFAAIKK